MRSSGKGLWNPPHPPPEGLTENDAARRFSRLEQNPEETRWKLRASEYNAANGWRAGLQKDIPLANMRNFDVRPWLLTLAQDLPPPSSSPTRTLSRTAMRNRRLNPNTRSRKPRNAGFTLLELLLVLAILVVIGGIVTVNIGGAQTEAKINATKAQLNGLKSNITQFQIRMNGLPESLEALRDGPSDSAKKAKWVAPIINEIPTDAWENQLVYSVNGNTYEIRSGGVDGQVNTDDDIIVEGS